MPPRSGSAIAGRPAENGHGPPPRVFTAPGLVSGEGLPIMPPRSGSAIAGRPAENGHGPPPRVFTAPGLVSR